VILNLVILIVVKSIVLLANGVPGMRVLQPVVVVLKLVFAPFSLSLLVEVMPVLLPQNLSHAIHNAVQWIVLLVDGLPGARVQRLVVAALKLVLVLSLPMLLAVVLFVLDFSNHEIVILNVAESIVWSVLGNLLDRVLQLVVVVLTLEPDLSLYNLHAEVLIALLSPIHSLVIQIAVQWIASSAAGLDGERVQSLVVVAHKLILVKF